MSDFYDEDNNVFRTMRNDEISENLYERENGDIVNEEGFLVANRNDDNFEDRLDEYEEDWRDTNWSRADWADFYGCDEKDVQDCVDDDDRWD